jgi:hypothetical protein
MTTETITLDPHFKRSSSLVLRKQSEMNLSPRGQTREKLQGPWSDIIIAIYLGDEIRQISFPPNSWSMLRSMGYNGQFKDKAWPCKVK